VAQIQQLVMNLLINAMEAIGEKAGEIVLRTAVTDVNFDNQHYWQYTVLPLQFGRYVQLSIADSGSGMSAETTARIFDPFFSTKEKGHGLGLAAVLGIVKGHEGGMAVRSVLGAGTTFDFVFPICAAPAPEAAPDQESAAAAAAGKVLVIDDEALVREAVADILATVAIESVPADCGRAGLALYQQHQSEIGLVLLDLSMPGWDGVRTLQELHRFDSAVQVLLSSGYSQTEVMSRFSPEVAPVGFLKKPYSVNELLAAVQSHLRDDKG
jgi:CheY-like chemotaxis protein